MCLVCSRPVPVAAPLRPFVDDPGRSALLFDIDGTLAPIVDDPAQTAVPDGTKALLARAVERFGLVGCVSGRRAEEAARLLPVPGLVFVGNHGLELREGEVVHTVPDVDPYLAPLRALVRALMPIAAAAGAFVEDKGPTISIHYRRAPDPPAAEAALEREAVPAIVAAGLEPRFGRMVLEVRPPVPVDKGTGVARLLRGRRLERSLFAGDDRSDIDAFRVVDVGVAVRSPEAPPELEAAATLAVDGPEGVTALLETLLGAG